MIKNKCVVLIDGSNNSQACKMAGIQLDWSRVRQDLTDNYGVFRFNYYTAVWADNDNRIAIQPLIDWLSFNGYTVVSKPAKEQVRDDGTTRIKGNMDMEIAVDALSIAPFISHVMLFSGDGDFAYLINALKQQGIHVTVVSTVEGKILANDLRRISDDFLDLKEQVVWHNDG